MTPILQHQFNCDNLSIAAKTTQFQYYFALDRGVWVKEDVREFLQGVRLFLSPHKKSPIAKMLIPATLPIGPMAVPME